MGGMLAGGMVARRFRRASSEEGWCWIGAGRFLDDEVGRIPDLVRGAVDKKSRRSCLFPRF